MDIESYVVRIFAAAAYGATAFVGLLLAGANFSIIISISALVGVLQLLNILTSFARGGAALMLTWGALTYAGITPDASTLISLKAKMADMAHQAKEAQNDPQAVDESVEKKLQLLRDMCEKKILDQSQCDAAKAKIYESSSK